MFSVVEHEMSAPATDEADSSTLPDWAIAVIVIGLGSFAFVLVFGITVVRYLMSYQHNIWGLGLKRRNRAAPRAKSRT